MFFDVTVGFAGERRDYFSGKVRIVTFFAKLMLIYKVMN